jgi:DNA-binding NarL/FixJ family response regulator
MIFTMIKRGRILIVEDEGLVALDIEERIKSLGHEVIGVASTGDEAVELTLKHAPHIVIMDVTLKGDIDGIEAARRILGQSKPVVIFMTAHSDRDTLERIRAVGEIEIVPKPLSMTDLSNAVSKAFVHGIPEE